MQELKMSMDEIEEKFTKSELIIMSWTSQEQAAGLEEETKRKRSSIKSKTQLQELTEELSGKEIENTSPVRTQEGLPDNYYNEEGEVDLRKVSGKEAVRLLSAMGMHFMPMMKR